MDGVYDAVVADPDPQARAALQCPSCGRSRVLGQQGYGARDAAADLGVELAQCTSCRWSESHLAPGRRPLRLCRAQHIYELITERAGRSVIVTSNRAPAKPRTGSREGVHGDAGSSQVGQSRRIDLVG